MRFTTLPPHVDTNAIAKAVREVLAKLKASGHTYNSLKSMINASVPDEKDRISANSLSLFLTGGHERIHVGNKIIPAAYEYIHDNWFLLSTDIRDFASTKLSAIHGYNYINLYMTAEISDKINIACDATKKLLRIADDSSLHTTSDRIGGQFYFFRKSTEKAHIILRSTLIIEPRYDKNVIFAVHINTEQDESERLFFGYVIPLGFNLHFYMSSSDQFAAIEHIVINYSSVQIKQSFGFIETPDSPTHNVPVSARIFLIRRSDELDKLGPRIDLNEDRHNGNTLIKKIENGVDTTVARQIRR